MAQAAAMTIQVELFGLAQLACGRRQFPCEVPSDATLADIVVALAACCPALVGLAIRRDLSGLYESYVLNVNGLQFIAQEPVHLQPGILCCCFQARLEGKTMYGYHGSSLCVDLTTRRVWWEALSEQVLRRFIGGTGLGTYLLYRHCPPGVEPFAPANPLIFVTSPLVGSRLTMSSKFAVLTKSPLTGCIGDVLSSSLMATELKKTGCDALVITGKSPFPCLLSIDDGGVRFLDATPYLGLSTSATERAIKERLGQRTRIACIGPAGERLVRFASITNDGGRQAARTGPGAVMGSKYLKAIAVRGTQVVPIWNAAALERSENLHQSPLRMSMRLSAQEGFDSRLLSLEGCTHDLCFSRV